MAKAAFDRLLAGRTRCRGTLGEAAKARQVLLVFGEQHCKQAMGRDETQEMTLSVDHGQGGLLATHGVPRSDFLIDPWSDDWSVTVHQLSQCRVGWRGQEVLECHDAEELAALADDNVTRAVISLPHHVLPHGLCEAFRADDRNIGANVLDRALESNVAVRYQWVN
jgi:hypothetical protein